MGKMTVGDSLFADGELGELDLSRLQRFIMDVSDIEPFENETTGFEDAAHLNERYKPWSPQR